MTSVVQPTEPWGSNKEAPTTTKEEKKEPANKANTDLTDRDV